MARVARYTVDASVFLNAFNPYEAGHEVSRAFLAQLQKQAFPIIVPTLLLPELAATVGRGQRDAELARRFATQVARLPHLLLIPLDTTLAQQAVTIAADYRLRGSDAVYAAVALRFGCALITLDREQGSRVNILIETYFPAEALTELEGANQ